MNVKYVQDIGLKIKENINKVIIGKDSIIEILLTSIIAGGHVLLEDVPGTGKTMLSRSLAKSISGDFKRIQFTPDLLPSDLTGINYYNQKLSEFTFRKGPLFTNILLADEINRATPRTQSALLECMEEKQVSLDGITYTLDKPFLVIATQNPVETLGTFPLPEAQLDRFFIKLSMGYPSLEEGKAIFKRFTNNNPLENITSVCTKAELIKASQSYEEVFISDDLMEYILKIVDNTLKHDNIALGISPRGSLALLKASQAYAALKGREYVVPEDIQMLVPYVFGHRIILKDSARLKGITPTSILENIMSIVEVPTENWNKI